MYIHIVVPSDTINMPIIPVLSIRNLPEESATIVVDISILFCMLGPFISMTWVDFAE